MNTAPSSHAEVEGWDVPQGHGGRITVGDDLSVIGRDRIYAAGDIASSPADLPQLAQPAIQGGAHIGDQIQRHIAGLTPTPFKYHDKGTMATIGRFAAVVELPNKVGITGLTAWAMWVLFHVYSLLGNGNRVSTMVRFLLRYCGSWYRRAVPIVGEVRPVRPNGDRTGD